MHYLSKIVYLTNHFTNACIYFLEAPICIGQEQHGSIQPRSMTVWWYQSIGFIEAKIYEHTLTVCGQGTCCLHYIMKGHIFATQVIVSMNVALT